MIALVVFLVVFAIAGAVFVLPGAELVVVGVLNGGPSGYEIVYWDVVRWCFFFFLIPLDLLSVLFLLFLLFFFFFLSHVCTF